MLKDEFITAAICRCCGYVIISSWVVIQTIINQDVYFDVDVDAVQSHSKCVCFDHRFHWGNVSD